MNKIIQLFKITLLAITFGTISLAEASAQTDVALPSDAGVYNVKNYGATGNGTTDDTVAFQAAIAAALDAGGTTANPNRANMEVVILYIPNGTYLLSNTLQSRDGHAAWDGWVEGMYLQGQSQTGTILKLKNSCSGFTSAALPKAVLQTGSEDTYTNTAKTITSLTSTGATATAVCTAHGYTTGQSIKISGATPTGYNNLYAPITVIDANTFTYTVASGLASPATGTITAASYTAGDGNVAPFHYIRNLTIDVGTGNAGAVGIDYLDDNQGGIYNVTIKSSDTGYVGYTGLMMDRQYPGPAIVKNLTVTGFTTGISMRSPVTTKQYGMTLDNITLSHQLSYGIENDANSMNIDTLTSSNSVPVIYTKTTTAHQVLLNGTFTGGVSGNNALTGSGSVYCRNVTSTGYGDVISNTNGNNVAGNGSTPVTVPEYESTATFKGFSSNINGSIQLPIEETPDFNDTTMTDWVNGATAAPVVGGDYLASIQAAIASGKPVVYLPRGSYGISNTIHLSGSVQKFIGCCAYIHMLSGFPAGAPMIQFDGGTAAYTDIQNIYTDGPVVDNSAQTLALENIKFVGYSNTSSGTGNLFVEDSINKGLSINYPQFVWARQLNIEEVTTSSVFNNGGAVWILGFKTENQSTCGSLLVNENGGWAELLGGFFYTLSAPTVPMIINNNSSLSANYMMDPYSSFNWPENIQDIEGTTYNFTNTNCTLYSGAATVFSTVEAAFGPTDSLTLGSNVWTFGIVSGGGYQLRVNGAWTGSGTGVTMFDVGGTLYATHAAGTWYDWNGTAWANTTLPSGLPTVASAAATSGSLSVNGNTWSFGTSTTGGYKILQNSVQAGTNGGVSMFNDGGTVEIVDSTGAWYYWSGGAWVADHPTGLGTTGIAYPTAGSLIITSANSAWTFGTTTTGGYQILKAGVQAGTAGGVAIFNLNSTGVPVIVDSTGAWWSWNGTAWTSISAPTL